MTFLCYRWRLVYKPAQALRHHNIGCQMALNTKKQMKINYRKWHLFQMFSLTFFFPTLNCGDTAQDARMLPKRIKKWGLGWKTFLPLERRQAPPSVSVFAIPASWLDLQGSEESLAVTLLERLSEIMAFIAFVQARQSPLKSRHSTWEGISVSERTQPEAVLFRAKGFSLSSRPADRAGSWLTLPYP